MNNNRLLSPTDYHLQQELKYSKGSAVNPILNHSNVVYTQQHGSPNNSDLDCSEFIPPNKEYNQKHSFNTIKSSHSDHFLFDQSNHDFGIQMKRSSTDVQTHFHQESNYNLSFQKRNLPGSSILNTIPSFNHPDNNLSIDNSSTYDPNHLEDYSTQANMQAIIEKRRKRRESHNAVERRRRDNINERIQELGTLLPESVDDGINKMNKGTILRKSIDQIRYLQNHIVQYQQRIRDLEMVLNQYQYQYHH